jgi:glutathione S-transferase
MKLLIAKPSPFARKVRIALLEKGLPFETAKATRPEPQPIAVVR